MPLVLINGLTDRIRAHAAEAYPHECCGALFGRDADTVREILDLLPLPNQHESSPRKRFVITPEDFRRAEAAARDHALDLVGWYHSHPDHPALPSEFDRQHAWPWYSYVILSVARGTPGEMTAWRLADDRSRFGAETIEMTVHCAAEQH